MGIVFRVLVAVGLGVDAYVHFHLAGDVGQGGTISEGLLFRVQAVVAVVVALVILVKANRATYAVAFLVAASALGAVLLYRYVDVGTLGPLPNMYEPVWYTEKTVTTIAEAVATLAAVLGFLTTRTRSTTPMERV